MQSLNPDPLTYWFTGLPASGKSTLAAALERELRGNGTAALVLDGDVMRRGLSRNLGYSASDRRENIRRVAEVARLLNLAGIVAVAALISPARDDRRRARAIIGAGRFVEVHVSTPLAVCEARDPKGHYRRARAGAIAEFTGVSAPYEAPESPDLTLDTSEKAVEDCVAALMALVKMRG